MKHIAIVVAVSSLLTTPLALAQTAPQFEPRPSDMTPKRADTDADFYLPRVPPSSVKVEGSFDETDGTDPHPGTWSPVKGSILEQGEPTDVETSFPSSTTGS
jgi:hypothetical protein